jgi:hypothetical protein
MAQYKNRAEVQIFTKCGKCISYSVMGDASIVLDHLSNNAGRFIYIEGDERVPTIIPTDNIAYVTAVNVKIN